MTEGRRQVIVAANSDAAKKYCREKGIPATKAIYASDYRRLMGLGSIDIHLVGNWTAKHGWIPIIETLALCRDIKWTGECSW